MLMPRARRPSTAARTSSGARKAIADTEQQIAAERSAAARKTASEKLARDLDAIEKALPI
jgi:hypothetical protein